jgi:hypothetical protein
MPGRRLALLGSVCLLAASCARSTGPTGAPASPASTQIGPIPKYGAVLTVGPEEAGKTVVLGAGDTLVFTVPGTASSPESQAWRLVSYPRDLIALITRSARLPFRFRALHAGLGDLRLASGPRCGGPGPLAAGDQQCPVVGDAEMGPPGFVSRLLVFHLKVLARG